jgi:hypothetical protein
MNRQKIRLPIGAADTPTVRFLRCANSSLMRELEQLLVLSELVKVVGELIHALQKERGASSIFLGSSGLQFAQGLAARTAGCLEPEHAVREHLCQVDEKLQGISCGTRLYTRVALVFRALDKLPGLRGKIRSLAVTSPDAVRSFTGVIGCLLAVVFEVANIAADPSISRALVALVSFTQGKEYAGQERATAAAAFSRGSFNAGEHRHMQNLVTAQEQAFRIFSEFAHPAHSAAFNEVVVGRDSAEVRRLRAIAFVGGRVGELVGITADEWFEQTTRRIDALKTVEDRLVAGLKRLCADCLAEACSGTERARAESFDAMADSVAAGAPCAIVLMDVEPALNTLGVDGGVGVFSLDATQPKPMHSILEVIRAQSRRIDDISSQLESALTALTERKVIERAKTVLIRTRRLSETAAYALMRETAMSQNKRIFEVAEAVVSMAEILKA